MLLVDEVDAIGIAITGHVGEDDLVSDLQAIEYLDGVHRRAPGLHVDAHRFCTVIHNLEQRNRGICRGLHWASHVENVLDPFDINGGVDFESSPGSSGHVIEGELHAARVVCWGWGHVADVPVREGALSRGYR